MARYKPLNIVLVGDPKVGKSTLISTCHIQNVTSDENGYLWFKGPPKDPKNYSPTSIKSYRTDIRLRGYYSMPYTKQRVFQTYIIELGGSRRYDEVRPLAYMDCDVFILCFDLTNRASLQNLQSKWIPEIKQYESQTPIILLGIKADLKTKRQVMAGKEVQKLSKTLGLDRYIEVSSYDDENVYALFTTAVELAFLYRKQKCESSQEGEEEEVIKFDVNELDSLSDPPVFTKKVSTTLFDDWQETLNNSRLTDVIIKFADSSPDVHAHKFVLSLASRAVKNLLRDVTSCQKTILGSPLQSSKIEKPLATASSKGKYSCENSCSCVPKGVNLLTDMPFKQEEEEFCKNFTNRTTNLSCNVDCHKLEITFGASIDSKAFKSILKWMYTGVLHIPEELDETFVELLYHVVLELEIQPLKVFCHRLIKCKAKGSDLRVKQKRAMSASERETLQADVNPVLLQEHEKNGNVKEDEEVQNVTTVPEPPPLELFELFISQTPEKKAVFVPALPSLESFEIYLNQKQTCSTANDQSHRPTDKAMAENVKIDANIAYKEMWRRADKLLNKDHWLTDTVLVVEDTPISVHRVVLATRSQMLAAMLEGGFKEKEYSEIRLPGVSLEHFHTTLEFLYTDKCVLDKDNLPNILELADRFCIESLIHRCEEFLLWTFSTYDYRTLAAHREEQVGSIMESIHLSKTYNARFLHKWCLHHVATNYSFFEGAEDFESVWAENEEFMERNRWPSRKCYQLLKSYKEKSRQKGIVSNASTDHDFKCSNNKKCCVM